MYRIAFRAGAAALLAGCKLPGRFPEQKAPCTFDNIREEHRIAYHLHRRSKQCGYDLNNGQIPGTCTRCYCHRHWPWQRWLKTISEY